MEEGKPTKTPMINNKKYSLDDEEERVDAYLHRTLVGNLLYLTNCIPYISLATGILSRFIQSPSKLHYCTAKRILRYLKGTSSFGIRYGRTNNSNLYGYYDSDSAGSIDDRQSTLGYIFTLGSGAISWSSKKQATTALSSAEAEYTTVVAC
ncbi:secreted RxLR effector protein 161-like [Jatropha curcas]|uniref:secreted RxLR effector protein 161-like n=1 Tax=Jatropha curcas TaxID=180498 RepID=UPI001894D665|nr:secreted RxLR effector protein 161-like [Jatropha curcas]